MLPLFNDTTCVMYLQDQVILTIQQRILKEPSFVHFQYLRSLAWLDGLYHIMILARLPRKKVVEKYASKHYDRVRKSKALNLIRINNLSLA